MEENAMKMKNLVTMMTIAVFALLCLTACSGVNITSVGLPTDVQIEKGETVQLEVSFGADKEDAAAEAITKAAEGLTLEWSSSDEKVATVDENGLVTAVGGGEADITVSIKDANIQSVCKVTVNVALEKIDVPENMALVINGEDAAELEAKLVPEDATGVELNYESSDESVATVDEDGKVTAIANGECIITVSCGDKKAETTVQVDTSPTALVVEDMEITVGKTSQMEVGFEGEDSTVGMELTFQSSDEEVATVGEDGIVTSVAAVEADITVTNEYGLKAICKVVVTEAVRQQATTTQPAVATPSTQPSGGNGGGAAAPTPAPTPAPQPDPAPATQSGLTHAPESTPRCPTCGLPIGDGHWFEGRCLFDGNHPAPPPEGGAAGGSIGDVIPGGGTDEGAPDPDLPPEDAPGGF